MNRCDHNEALHPTRMDIPLEVRGYVIQLLNQTLAFTVDLRTHVKQAGWNVRGQDFFPLQALFTTVASELDAYADLVAERIAVLGGVARGTARTAAMQSRLADYPDALVADRGQGGGQRGGECGLNAICRKRDSRMASLGRSALGLRVNAADTL